ncbi:Phytochrome, two-component sensor histidine kinase [Marinobacterium lacunae]|uniref:Diguanylate cyclase DosC n=1 Tax=Marinobacterium lacunae TaxID=1232683 RepID=A0A081FZR8_9GAMM|nr:GGDEF domain-containing protein [Marinobacterium lacunae]KEA64023.1 Phytochrome, two-component sensor histidine kinase [Marinobacterium lacunae]MBR9885282.1 GGDEF domain-containing protein [Oceanospirillales bacterium]
MKQTDQTLLEQLRITEFEIENRQRLFMITERDIKLIVDAREIVESGLGGIVDTFYEMQTNTPEIALLIGDADTLQRLRNAQQRYISDLFSGVYDIDYVNNRLRIGLVHKRIGVDTKLYLSAVYTLKSLIADYLGSKIPDADRRMDTLQAVEKVFMFDITLVFETYIRSLLSEIETSREKSEEYARILEEKVRERTHQLERMARTDPLTGLQSVRYLNETLTRYLRMAENRSEMISLVYIDINDFKLFNDTEGHQRGDEILRNVGNAILQVSRSEDGCFRYGGDEFCIILPRCNARQAQDICVNRLVEALAECEGAIRLSIGIAQAGPDYYPSAGQFLSQADRAMYQNKAEHKGQDTEQPECPKSASVRLIGGQDN